MAASQAQLEYDAQGKPLPQVEYDAAGNPLGTTPKEDVITAVPPVHVTPDIAKGMWKAGVHSKMLGITPGMAYENRDEVDNQLRERAGDYDSELDPTIANDIRVGFEGSIFGLHHREKMPEQVHDPGFIDKFISGLSTMVADLPFYVAGGVAGGAAGSEVPVVGTAIGAAAGGFALPAAVREALVLSIKNGEVKDFKDLLHRAADVTWEATKGAAVGTATELAGGLPVGSLIAKSGAASIAMKGLYQATALTTAADLLEGKVPNLNDFASNAALVIPLNLVTHGMAMKHGDARTALEDAFVKNGTTPKETVDKLSAQPPVKPDLPEGLRPAIKIGDGPPLEGDVGEPHSDLAARLGSKPVSMEELQADPSKAEKVLQEPQTHEQSVIDEALKLKREELEGGSGETPEYDPASMKSGRGFVTPEGKFLTREQAKNWMKENEPEVHEMWSKEGYKELHSKDYKEARDRVEALNLAEGSIPFTSMSGDLAKFWAGGRGVLNGIKAGLMGSEYGASAIRTLLVGPHNAFVTEAAQVVGKLRKLVPDAVDQRAISFMRDYRDNPEALRKSIDEINAGSNERLKAYIPSMERALHPTPKMLEADGQLTEYFRNALNRARSLQIMDSSIDPARYSPRMFVRQMEEGTKGFGRTRFTEKTPHAIQREYLHLLDPLKSGEFEARTFNAFDELAIYGDRHATAVSTKLFTTELRNSALGVEGTRESHPEGWQLLSGSNSLYVPKKIADALEPMLARGGELSAVAKFLHVQQITKAIELGLSFFHIKAMGITALNNMGVDGYLRTMHSDNSSPAFEAQERHHALYGLTTTNTGPEYEAYKGSHPSDIPTGFDKLANLPVIKQVDAFAKGITRATFDVIQRKFKVVDMSTKEAAWIAKHPEATDQEYGAAMRSIAKEVNAAYGGLNWDVMGVSRGMRDMYRMFLLAPDWTFSNIVNAKYAFQGGPSGVAARMFFIKSFTTGFAMTAAMSIAIGGKYDPTDIQHMDQVFLGIDKDGKRMYVNLFFAGAPKDLMTWVKKSISDTPIAGTAAFVVNKAAPIIGTLGHLAMNVDYGSKPIYKKKDSFGKQLLDQGAYAAERVTPISVVSGIETVARALKDPSHEYSYKDLLELAGDAMGSQVTRTSPKAQSSEGGHSLVIPGGGAKGKKWTSPLGKKYTRKP